MRGFGRSQSSTRPEQFCGHFLTPLELLAALSAFGAYLGSRVMGANVFRFPVRSAVFDFFWAHYQEIALAQIPVGLVVAFCALMFLRRKGWALIAIQLFAVLNIIWAVVFVTYWIRLLRAITEPVAGEVGTLAIRVAFTIMGIVISLLYCACGCPRIEGRY